MAEEAEEVLSDGGITHVVRIGDTVRRPAREFTDTVQAYLAHLRSAGVDFVPQPLGYDEQGREVLGYVAGDIPTEPVPIWATTDDVLVALARMIRRLHDAAISWVPPADAVWGRIPGSLNVPTTPLFDAPELVSHQDYCPGNVVFRDHLPAALIDFDLAKPTTRVADCANAMRWWVPFLAPEDRTPALRDANIPHRARVFADAYGLDRAQRIELVEVAVQGVRNAHVTMRAAAEVDPVFRRWWDDSVRDRMPRTEAWIDRESASIRQGLVADL